MDKNPRSPKLVLSHYKRAELRTNGATNLTRLNKYTVNSKQPCEEATEHTRWTWAINAHVHFALSMHQRWLRLIKKITTSQRDSNWLKKLQAQNVQSMYTYPLHNVLAPEILHLIKRITTSTKCSEHAYFLRIELKWHEFQDRINLMQDECTRSKQLSALINISSD